MDDLNNLIAKELKGALAEVVKSRLNKWDGPLAKFVDEVVLASRDEIKGLLREGLTEALTLESFRIEIKASFTHTLARSLMNEYKGEIEKQANALRQAPEFRARVVLAIEQIVNDSILKKETTS